MQARPQVRFRTQIRRIVKLDWSEWQAACVVSCRLLSSGGTVDRQRDLGQGMLGEASVRPTVE